MKKYKGYTATVQFDPDEMLLHGRIDNIRDVVTFHATSTSEVQREFEAAVDDYLAYCAEREEEPEKPYSGRILVRMEPELHRAFATTAERAGQSLNAWLVKAAEEAIHAPARDAERAKQEEGIEAIAAALQASHNPRDSFAAPARSHALSPSGTRKTAPRKISADAAMRVRARRV